MTTNNATIYQRPAELLQALIRFDTTNQPGFLDETLNFIRFTRQQSIIE